MLYTCETFYNICYDLTMQHAKFQICTYQIPYFDIAKNSDYVWTMVYNIVPDNKVHVTNMGPTWVLSVPGRPHVGLMNFAIRESVSYMLRASLGQYESIKENSIESSNGKYAHCEILLENSFHRTRKSYPFEEISLTGMHRESLKHFIYELHFIFFCRLKVYCIVF